MLSQKNDAFKETCKTVYKLNQNKEVRYLSEMREEGQRILRTYQILLKQRDAKLAEQNATIAQNAATIAEQEALIASLQAQIKALQK